MSNVEHGKNQAAIQLLKDEISRLREQQIAAENIAAKGVFATELSLS